MIARFAWSALRIAYGGFFAVVGAWGAISLARGEGNPFVSGSGPGPDFQEAMEATGFLVPLMLAMFILGGLALAVRRTAPLGIILLAPFVAVIFFYHLLLGGSAAWAFGWASGLLLLAWHHRSAFVPLVTFDRS